MIDVLISQTPLQSIVSPAPAESSAEQTWVIIEADGYFTVSEEPAELARPIIVPQHFQLSRVHNEPEAPSLILGSLQDAEYDLSQPIELRIVEDAGQIAVVWELVSEFGYGDSVTTAVTDFRRSLVELFLELESSESQLSPNLRETLDTIRSFVARSEYETIGV